MLILVLVLKNEDKALPLARGAGKVLVVGDSADSLSNQTGGWSLTWQGTENSNADFATGSTLLGALKSQLGAENVVYSPDGSGVDMSAFSKVVVVLGGRAHYYEQGDAAVMRAILEDAGQAAMALPCA